MLQVALRKGRKQEWSNPFQRHWFKLDRPQGFHHLQRFDLEQPKLLTDTPLNRRSKSNGPSLVSNPQPQK
jgi:hypothetical protein